jgi:hypothetical protein
LCVPNGSPFEAGKEDVRLNRRQPWRADCRFLSQPIGRPGRVVMTALFVLNADGRSPGLPGCGGASPSPNGGAMRGRALRPGRKFVAEDRFSRSGHA